MSQLPEREQNGDRRSTAITVLWAVHDEYPVPHVVRAWSHALEQAGYGLTEEIAEAVEWMEHWGDESGWRYWTTVEHVPEAGLPEDPDDWVVALVELSSSRPIALHYDDAGEDQ